jgi:hypothetical protein
MPETRMQAVTGLIPPETREALIREAWPSVAAHPGPAALGRVLMLSIIAAPLGWLLLAPLYFAKILPFVARRYTLTNRRVMIRRGLKPAATHEVPLAAVDEVRVVKNANSEFYRAGTLEIISGGKVALTLPGMPEPESFRHAIINASKAWVAGKASEPIVPAKSAT